MLKITNVLRQLKFFKIASNHFVRLNNTRLSKSVLLNNDKNPTTELNKTQEEKIPHKAKADENKIESTEIPDSKRNKDLPSDSGNSNKFDFESFKNRNMEITKNNNLNSNSKLNSKLKLKSKNKQNEEFEGEDDKNQQVEKQEFDQKLIAQLNKYIMEDTSFFTDQGKKVNEFSTKKSDEVKEEIFDQEFENKFDGILVKRPPKGFVWGMGNQANKKKYKFEQGEIPTVDALVKYLQASNLKDIVIVPTRELGFSHLKDTSIVSVGFSSKHIYKSAKDLSVEIKNLKIPGVSDNMLIYGRRDEEWLLVEIGPDISVYFFTEAFNKEVDIVNLWTNRPTEEDKLRENKLKSAFYKNKFNKF